MKELDELKELLRTELDLEDQMKILKIHKTAILEKIEPKMKTDILSTEFCSITKDFRATVLSENGIKKYCDQPAPRVNKQKVKDAIESGIDIGADIEIEEYLLVRKKRHGFDQI